MGLEIPPEIQERYGEAIKEWQVAFPDLELEDFFHGAWTLLDAVVCECEIARRWASSPPASATERSRDRAALDNAEKMAGRAAELARFVRAGPTQMSPVMMQAVRESGVRLTATGDRCYSAALADFLEVMASELKAKRLAAQRGPFLHRRKHGPIWFPKPIDWTAEVPSATTCLAVALSFLFRAYDVRGTIMRQEGEPLLREGRPRWGLVNTFVTAALGQDDADRDYTEPAKKFLQRNPKIGIGSWT